METSKDKTDKLINLHNVLVQDSPDKHDNTVVTCGCITAKQYREARDKRIKERFRLDVVIAGGNSTIENLRAYMELTGHAPHINDALVGCLIQLEEATAMLRRFRADTAQTPEERYT